MSAKRKGGRSAGGKGGKRRSSKGDSADPEYDDDEFEAVELLEDQGADEDEYYDDDDDDLVDEPDPRPVKKFMVVDDGPGDPAVGKRAKGRGKKRKGAKKVRKDKRHGVKGRRRRRRPPERAVADAPEAEGDASDYLSLSRLQTGALTAMAPVAGFLAAAFASDTWVVPRAGGPEAGPQATLLFLALLFCTGLCMHVFGFVLNEILDLPLDRRAGHLSKKPLVSGRVSVGAAVSMALWGLVGAFLLLGLIRYLYHTFSFTAVWYLGAAFVFGALYDVFSKRMPGSDLFLGVWAYLFCLMGASLAADDIPAIAHLLGLLGAMQIIFNNSVEGGMKDADTDRASGVDNIAVRMGVGTRRGRLFLPPVFRGLAWSMKGLSIAFVLGFLLVSSPIYTTCHAWFSTAELDAYHELWYEDGSAVFFFLLTALILGLVVSAAAFLLPKQPFRRKEMFRTFSRHEILTYALVPVMLIPLCGPFWSAALFVLPVLWYVGFNTVVHGSAMQPGV